MLGNLGGLWHHKQDWHWVVGEEVLHKIRRDSKGGNVQVGKRTPLKTDG
jgi:hypothetical protein